MSLPGAMSTFLNIGMNDEITLKLSTMPNFGWTAWDCYRRLLQSWGMAYGIDRDEFDAVMISYKRRYKVQLKTQFTPEQMRDMCTSYKKVLARHKVSFEQDVFLQLKQAINHVLDSWNTDRARLYRQKLQIADDWGTAVLIQKMILGNISLDSGTGVAFTYADWSKEPGITLNGDFTLCSQGEDVVAGLVYTLPISEQQRKLSKSPVQVSLEKDFPDIYARLLSLARQLVEERGYPHQEIEFTFEGPRKEQLYILQTRNQLITKVKQYTVFSVPKRELKLLGNGIGVGKGVLNGIIVISRQDIDELKDMNLPLILVKPDTVPEDMELLFDCQGLLTSRGGVTSHAAVTAVRLGIIGVVNCRQLKVIEEDNICRIGDYILRPGDKIAIDASSGSIYLGHYPVETIPG
jgi:pyruvate,orthophosphate dikinase